MDSNKWVITLFSLCFCAIFYAQKPKVKSDSLKLYHDIYEYSQKNKLNRFFHRLLFKNPTLDSTTKKTVQTVTVQTQAQFQGKIIRNINIVTLDPFGYSVTDSLKKPNKKFETFGNKIHIKTRNNTIKDLLLFKENTRYDSLKITETERLIRSQRYTRKVRLVVVPVETSNDSIDIDIRILDSWSLIPNGSLSTSKGSFKLAERNLIGLGHQLSGNFKYRFDDDARALSGNYTISNIKNTYIKLKLDYDKDFNSNSIRSIDISRDFYSPLTRWGGGVYFENRTELEEFKQLIPDSTLTANTRSELFEFWLGHSFKLNKTSFFKDKRTTRFVTAIAFNHRVYKEAPNSILDPDSFFSDEKNIIGSIGISTQNYYQDKFLFNYDIIEDIPYGEIYSLTFGLQEEQNVTRGYFGSKIAYGKRFKFGYLSASAEFGTFLKSTLPSQTSFKTDFNYFTNLIRMGKWSMRQFIKPSFILGRNRFNTEKDNLTLNSDWGIDGFDSPITGTQKWILNLQTQTYTPGLWAGFRFSPYLNITLGSLANNKKIFDNKVYSKFSIGVLLNNDYLVFNSFQISFSYYPSIPFVGDNIFKTNSFENDNLTIPDFNLPKPGYIVYE
ncbi:MAG: hypothetical protein ACK5MZ_02685 [Aestuariibaculum sp.]